jgi:hypothetical protein
MMIILEGKTTCRPRLTPNKFLEEPDQWPETWRLLLLVNRGVRFMTRCRRSFQEYPTKTKVGQKWNQSPAFSECIARIYILF